jgi:hypothetical protein
LPPFTPPGTPPADIYANGEIIMRNLAYEQMTEYVPVAPGKYNVQVYPAGQTEEPLVNTVLTAPPERSYTIVLVGGADNESLLPIAEAYLPMVDRRSTYIRFVHLAPDAPK